MLQIASFIFIIACCILQAAAHGGVVAYLIGGVYYTGFAPYQDPTGQTSIQRPWATVDPIEDPTASTLACNDDGSSLASQLTATVSAGSDITAYWSHPWPHSTGPVITYLAECPGSTCTGVDAKSLKWFKIDEAGLISGSLISGQWAAAKMIAQNSTWTTTIPSSVPSGNYLIRFETISLQDPPAQIYPECAQIQIIGGGSTPPTASELVTFPGGYSKTDPGLAINIYGYSETQTTYIIPGPPLYGSGAAPSPAPGNSPSTTSVPTAATTPASTPSTPASTPMSTPVSYPMSPPASTPESTPVSAPVSPPASTIAPYPVTPPVSKPVPNPASTPMPAPASTMAPYPVSPPVSKLAPHPVSPSVSPLMSTPVSPSVSTPVSTPATSGGTTGTIAQYGQCGGIGYTGSTACISPFTCTSSGPYYSQCS